MGIVAAMNKMTALITAVVPIQDPGESFHSIDDRGAAATLEEVVRSGDSRCFDVGTVALPVGDGEAGAADCGTLRARVVIAVRVGYQREKGSDGRHLDGKVAEDMRRILTALRLPSGWDAATTGIVSIVPPDVPAVPTLPEGGGLIITQLFTVLYREEAA